MDYSAFEALPDVARNCVIYVHPRQYERMCKRRAQRDRQLMRRGKSRMNYVPLAVREEYPRRKRSRFDFEVPNLLFPPIGIPMQGYYPYPRSHYAYTSDYSYPSSKLACTTDASVASFSDVATLITGPSERGSYPGSVISASTAHSRGSELSPSKERSPTLVAVANEGAVTDSYIPGDIAASVDPSRENYAAKVEGSCKPDFYAPMGAFASKCSYGMPMNVGYASSASSSSTVATAGGYSTTKGVMPAHNLYSAPNKVALKAPLGGDIYLASNLCTDGYARACYPTESFSADACASDLYYKDGCASQLDPRGFYAPSTGSIMGYLPDYYNTATSGVQHQDLHMPFVSGFNVPMDMRCAYTPHMFGEMGTYPRHIMTKGLVMNSNMVDAGSLKSPMYSEFMYPAGADTTT